MKKSKYRLIYWVVAIVALLVISCGKDDVPVPGQEPPELAALVDGYIEDILNHEYRRYDTIPDFGPQAIPLLLSRADNYTRVKIFPIHILSPARAYDQTLCECLLWTVESIREFYGRDERKGGGQRCPSWVGLIYMPNDLSKRLSNEELKEALEEYRKWWNDNQESDFEDFRDIYPFEENARFDWEGKGFVNGL